MSAFSPQNRFASPTTTQVRIDDLIFGDRIKLKSRLFPYCLAGEFGGFVTTTYDLDGEHVERRRLTLRMAGGKTKFFRLCDIEAVWLLMGHAAHSRPISEDFEP